MTPLVLVVGFLGSGKTTFLKALIPELARRGIRPGLLINDYQNARVDAEQFRDLVAGVKALSGDCVCCGSRDQLLAELSGFEHGPNRVQIIETNGTTDSEQLIEALALDPSLRKFSHPIQLSVIDSKRWQKRFWHNALERGQARTASHLYLSRADSVPPERLAEVLESLAKHAVRGIPTTAPELAGVLAELCQNPDAADRGAPPCCGGSCGHHPDAPHAHHEHHHFASCEFPLPRMVEEKPFRAMLRALPNEVIRAKGVVRFHHMPGEFYVFQKLEDDVQFFPVGPAPRLSTPLVLFIGPRLPEDDLRAAIEALA